MYGNGGSIMKINSVWRGAAISSGSGGIINARLARLSISYGNNARQHHPRGNASIMYIVAPHPACRSRVICMRAITRHNVVANNNITLITYDILHNNVSRSPLATITYRSIGIIASC